MPRELIVLHIGQCGNQVGCRFWDVALQEHAAFHAARQQQHEQQAPVFDEAMSSFFRNVDSRTGWEIPVAGEGKNPNPISSLRARALLIDMEEGVLNSLQRGALRDLFDPSLVVTDVSGSGNNWGQGYSEYGAKHKDAIMNSVRRAAEDCDSLQSFVLLHSMGGGTGAGMGSFVIEQLSDEYPDVFRFVTAVFPSLDDDVITSPYNSVLALRRLREHASWVLPASNEALSRIARKLETEGKERVGDGGTEESPQGEKTLPGSRLTDLDPPLPLPQPRLTSVSRDTGPGRGKGKGGAVLRLSARGLQGRGADDSGLTEEVTIERKGSRGRSASVAVPSGLRRAPAVAAGGCGRAGGGGGKKSGFDGMNNLLAHTLTHLTCSMRFEGSLNVDLNEVTTNLVPFPKLHFLLPSLAPLNFSKDRKEILKSFDRMFVDALGSEHQLTALQGDPRSSTCLAAAFLVRGRHGTVGDVQRNVRRAKKDLRLLPFSEDAIKVGICNAPAIGQPFSLLHLSNNCAVSSMFSQMGERFHRLYRHRAHVHHYASFIDVREEFPEALESVSSLQSDYATFDQKGAPPSHLCPSTESLMARLDWDSLDSHFHLSGMSGWGARGGDVGAKDRAGGQSGNATFSQKKSRRGPCQSFEDSVEEILQSRFHGSSSSSGLGRQSLWTFRKRPLI
uniref:Tubulin/FtsZ GTPase domain-containing protein n=1 Tax=Chromera velia CCMP2878 TaxID=1169474 RepID=A0A0G4HTN4_9ALVE|eukprot:Cvel_8512.t1-p1 / transcript=Cvel_8512.t1 / gene=Cvel_8512 / organism=Chromera_velia_CCMP2878 / gene_product=Tubulin epsilon chain, putative / transcript_product=Tubulin epsilon chain, putative / location=Cvel_scaffold471:34914-42415(-) / protein_length=674 / sequence_SO=supercontig / SO=protein_coding / is_pseudo=false